MKKNRFTFMLIIISIIIIIDLYAFKGMYLLCRNLSSKIWLPWLYGFYWVISAVSIIVLYASFNIKSSEPSVKQYNQFFILAGILFSIYFPKAVFGIFHLTEDFIFIISKGLNKIPHIKELIFGGHPLIRKFFLSKTGAILSIIPFSLIVYGILLGRFDVKVKEHNISFPHLPSSFNGLKIVQISDIHIGSFYYHKDRLKKAIRLVNRQNPDIVVFTGDLVNFFAKELDGWEEVFRNIQASKGKFSILGNHDYVHYYEWNSKHKKNKNFEAVKKFHNSTGFRLLTNKSVKIRHNGQEIALIGVENWGYPPFHQYGDILKATQGVEDIPFKILLTHDPSHWDAEVLNKTDIALTLSGHTHGMQFGILTGKFRWSPVQYRYKRWGGMYCENDQMLYVNVGLGYIGFPGRIGMRPEITVFNLSNKAD